MKQFAADVAPIDITLGELYAWADVLAVEVVETATLRGLHNRLNSEMGRQFEGVIAEHDGDDYRFHLTVAAGGASHEVYRQIHAAYSNLSFRQSFRAHELAMFVYDEWPPGRREYMTHTVLPLTGRQHKRTSGFRRNSDNGGT